MAGARSPWLPEWFRQLPWKLANLLPDLAEADAKRLEPLRRPLRRRRAFLDLCAVLQADRLAR